MRKLLKNKPLLITIVAVLAMVIMILLTSGSRTMSFIESAVGSVVQPVQTFAYKASDSIVDFFKNLFGSSDLHQENERLQTALAQYEGMANEYEAVLRENERLKELLNYSELSSDLKYVTASVIGKSQGVWFDIFTINAGRNHGIEVDMPVVNARGLVGRVTDVGATWCKITALIEPRVSVSVMVERTRENGMIRGTLNDNGGVDLLELYYMPANSDLVPGDKIVTNGYGGVFPKGITVGVITEVSHQTEGLSDYNALIQPAVDFTKIEEVMVITGIEEAQ